MNKFLLIVVIALQITVLYQIDTLIKYNWWHEEWETIRTQVSDLWYLHELDGDDDE